MGKRFTWTPEDVLGGVVFVFVWAAIVIIPTGLLSALGFMFFLLWHIASPMGAYQVQDDRIEQIAHHYSQGQHDRVVEVYERPLGIPLAPNVSWQKRTGFFHFSSIDMLIEVGHSYEVVGDFDAAELQYVLALGWDVDEYREHCRENGPCPTLAALRTFAEFRRDFERR